MQDLIHEYQQYETVGVDDELHSEENDDEDDYSEKEEATINQDA